MSRPGCSAQEVLRFEVSTSDVDIPAAGFEELAMPLFDSVYNFARWLAQNQSDAEDLVQETYLKALRNFASFQPGSNFRAWIFQILKNTFLSSRSKLDRRMTVAIDAEEEFRQLPVTSATPESLLLEGCGFDAVWAAIQELPVVFREVILLRDVEDMAYREIAQILSIPIGTVMSRLARGRQEVRESLRSAPREAPARRISAQIGSHQRGPCFA